MQYPGVEMIGSGGNPEQNVPAVHDEPSSCSDRCARPELLSDRTAVFVLLGVALVAGFPLLVGRALGGQDVVNYFIHAQQTAANFREMIFFPSWGGGYNQGFGSPVLIFFPPVTSVVHALPVVVGVPVVSGISLLVILGHFLSGLTTLGWLRTNRSVVPALSAAVIYMVAPYRLIDIYLRSAIAEHWAFIWPPLILWSSVSSRLSSPLRIFFVATGVAGLLLSNTPQAVLFGLLLALWFLVSNRIQRQRIEIAAGAGLGFVISSFSLVPQAMADSLLDLNLCFGASSRFRPSAATLFADGLETWTDNTTFSCSLLATLILVLIAYYLLPKTVRSERMIAIAVVLSVLGVFSTTTLAGPLWDAMPVLSQIQFPWRITSLLTLAAAALVARLSPLKSFVIVLITCALIPAFLNWHRTLPRSAFSPVEPPRESPGKMFPDPRLAWEAGSGGWYWRHESLVELCLVPKGTPMTLFAEFQKGYPRELTFIRDRPAALLEDREVPVSIVTWGQRKRTVEIETPEGGTLVWRVIPFPEMTIEIDGVPAGVGIEPVSGLLAHDLPPGRHEVTWRWRPFQALRWAQRASVAGMLCWLSIGVVGLFRQRCLLRQGS